MIIAQQIAAIWLFHLSLPQEPWCTVCCCCLAETPWTVAHRLLYPRDSPGKKTGVGSHALLQGIFLTQDSLLAQTVKNLPPMQETWVQSLIVI